MSTADLNTLATLADGSAWGDVGRGAFETLHTQATTPMGVDRVAAGSLLRVYKSGTWANRPTDRTDVTVIWIGDPGDPPIVTPPAINGAYDTDLRIITP